MFNKEQKYLKRLPQMLKTEWEDFSPKANGDILDVSCRCCPKHRSFPPRCVVDIGSRLRSCVIASIEYNFRNVNEKNILEIGCGENSFAQKIIELSGGKWLGLDPRAGSRGNSSVRSIAGEVHHIPCRDNYFDIVMGIQTIEHWPRNHSLESASEYGNALSEIWRVLKPGGSIYFDAPIFLHGAPEFIKGDIDGIRRFFSHQPWVNLKITSWGKARGLFMRKKIACRKERVRWPEIFHHDEQILGELRGKSTYIISIISDKPVSSACNNQKDFQHVRYFVA